jgi:hypothetical protein
MGVVVAGEPLNDLENAASGRYAGLPELRTARLALLHQACQLGAHRILALDPDFVDWPLSDAGLLDALSSWGRGSHRRLELLAPDFLLAERRHARLRQWRLHWDHLLKIGSFEPGEAGSNWPTSTLVVVGGQAAAVLQVLDFEHHRFTISRQPADRQVALELFDAIAQRSTPAWALSTLGL